MWVQGMDLRGERMVVQEGGAQLPDKHLRVVGLWEEDVRGELGITDCARGWSFSFKAVEFSGSECGLCNFIACGQIPVLLFTI